MVFLALRVTIFVLCIFLLLGYDKIAINELSIDLGASEGLSKTSTIPSDTLQKILAGVESGNKDNIYYYALLKLYGLSVSKDVKIAASNFLRASNLGHTEATTAYGVMLASGLGTEKDDVSASQYFRKAVNLGDMNAHWLLGK